MPPSLPPGFLSTFPPEAVFDPPPVILWFKLYAGLLAVLHGFIFLGGVVLAGFGISSGKWEAVGAGAFYIGMGLVPGAGCMIPFVLKPRPWMWSYGIAFISLSMANPFCIPFAIPLLIFWIREDNRLWYGMTE